MAAPQIVRLGLLADSLGLPRNIDDIAISETYPEMVRIELAKINPHNVVYTDARHARKMPDGLEIWENYFCMYDLTHLLIQIGVVDAAPRVFTLRENRFVSSIRPRFFKSFVISTASRHRAWFVKTRRKVYTKPKAFEESFRTLVEAASAQGVSIAAMSICHTHDALCKRSPGFNENMDKYNDILEKIGQNCGCEVLKPIPDDVNPADVLLTDGIHLNSNGASYFNDRIVDWIKRTQHSNQS